MPASRNSVSHTKRRRDRPLKKNLMVARDTSQKLKSSTGKMYCDLPLRPQAKQPVLPPCVESAPPISKGDVVGKPFLPLMGEDALPNTPPYWHQIRDLWRSLLAVHGTT
ncbi:hypothetical protein O9993_01645 [Vibrio lentus]|nr:hypothetical protein [Vibrio lentus]